MNRRNQSADPAVRGGAMHRLTFAVAILMASLSLVAWRQGEAFELQQDLEAVGDDVAEARAEQVQLEKDITYLSSRERITDVAAERLDLYPPVDQVRVVEAEGDR